MSTYFDIALQAARAGTAPVYANRIQELDSDLKKAQLRNGQLNDRIHILETALNRMVLMFENTLSDSEGHYPEADAGCIDCTCGTVPDKYNTGPCAFHAAKRLLGQL